jgi:hypothetical protein
MCNYVLLDSSGAAAVFENAHDRFAVRRMKDDYLICANHFVDPRMKICAPHVPDRISPEDLASSHSRYGRAVALVRENFGTIDQSVLRQIAQDHYRGKSYYSLCRHGETLGTIATFIGLPDQKKLFVKMGPGCAGADYHEFAL